MQKTVFQQIREAIDLRDTEAIWQLRETQPKEIWESANRSGVIKTLEWQVILTLISRWERFKFKER